jgi:hypothetical protein
MYCYPYSCEEINCGRIIMLVRNRQLVGERKEK